ncbi:caspase family protein [Actinomadura barringtoniae]|uniref:Caspase family protein n=1 Tax=Actinomadura barringtoniae TaxID=1427535 RepID=A0A939PQM6_9ACTN|nr:YDG/SRA domain-containing protein [Actinomadura barringtoniae]MBO2454379.1 caspase family protein [Actinomadura barringtoniae]
MKQPDPRASRAVLIGTAEYEYLPQLPAVANNLVDMKQELTRPEVWGLAPQHCEVVLGPKDAREMLSPVTQAGREATEVLLVYVAGHGLRDDQGNLLLGLPYAEDDADTYEYTAVAYDQLRRTMRRTSAKYRIVILDCCYSGAAINTMGSGDIAAQTPIAGSYVLASAPPNRQSMAPEGKRLTAFTNQLIDVIRDGIAEGDKLLTLDAIFGHIYNQLRSEGLPKPWQQDNNSAGQLPLLKNRALASQSTPPGYGEIPGVNEGTLFASRQDLHEAHVHRPLQAGICGRRSEGGAESIVVSGGYVDDEDHGDVIIYTGHGGQDERNHQVRDQSPTDSGNAALIASITSRYPVRVIRGAGGDSDHSPPVGFSYDGLYTVESYWAKKSIDGPRIIQFRLEKMREGRPPVVPTGTPGDRAGVDLTRWEPASLGVYRDRRVAAKVCRAHAYQCQICGLVLETPDGFKITPTTHLKSLAVPHRGPDIPANVLCLCPTHRVQFDLGMITIDDDLTVIDETAKVPLGKLAEASQHKVGLEYIRYHRSLYRREA